MGFVDQSNAAIPLASKGDDRSELSEDFGVVRRQLESEVSLALEQGKLMVESAERMAASLRWVVIEGGSPESGAPMGARQREKVKSSPYLQHCQPPCRDRFRMTDAWREVHHKKRSMPSRLPRDRVALFGCAAIGIAVRMSVGCEPDRVGTASIWHNAHFQTVSRPSRAFFLFRCLPPVYGDAHIVVATTVHRSRT